MIDGALACIYLGALFYAAPLIDRSDESLATRIRNTIVLAAAIPLTLAFVHALYVVVLWVVLAALVMARWRSRDGRTTVDAGEWLALSASLIVAWPSLVRPLLEGDSLFYHLPIAVSWVQSHSLWTTAAPYWYYPPGSEAIAAGMFAATGRFALPLAGILPMLLIVARLYEFGVARGASRWCSGAITIAFVCTPLVALQVGTLGNDVLLAALVVEVLASARTTPALLLLALVKPVGWLWGLGAAITRRLSWLAVLVAVIPLALFLARNLILRAGQPVVTDMPMPAYFTSTIAAHAPGSLTTLFWATLVHWPQAFVWIAFAGIAISIRETRAGGIFALLGLIGYTFLPFSYSGWNANYADASSLRFALPVLGCGALTWLCIAKRFEMASVVGALVLALTGAFMLLQAYFSDGYTLLAPIVMLVACGAALLSKRTRGVSIAIAAVCIVVSGAAGAALRSPGFFANWMHDSGGKPTQIFAWLVRQRPERLVTVDLRSGAVLMNSPDTVVIPSDGEHMCATATKEHALLVVSTNEDPGLVPFEEKRRRARRCGRVLFDDGANVVISP